MYEMADWFHDLKNQFQKLDRLTSEQSYRRIIDNIEEFLDAYQSGMSIQDVYEDFWN